MLCVRMLLFVVAVPMFCGVAGACEHCRAAEAAMAAKLAAESSPTDLAVAAIRTAGQELRQSEGVLKDLCAQTVKLRGVRDGMQHKLQVVASELQALRSHVHSGKYPVVLTSRIVRSESDAESVVGELLIEQDVLSAGVAAITAELAAGEQTRLQLVKTIRERETEIVLAEHRFRRIATTTVPDKSAQSLKAIRVIAPPGSSETQRKQRLNDFLRGGLGGVGN